MKKVVVLFLALLVTAGVYAQKAVDLDAAIASSADEIAEVLPAKTPVAVVKVFSESKEFSEYASDALVIKLTRKNKLTMLERNEKNTSLINAEVDFQYSGSVSDDSMVEIGYQLGAKYLVYGSFDQIADFLQFTVQAVNVETAEIVYLNSYTIAQSQKVLELLGDEKKLVSADDYIQTVARCDTKINAIQRDKAKEIQKKKVVVETEFNKKIAEVNAMEPEFYESDDEFHDRQTVLLNGIYSKYDKDVDAIEKSSGTYYDNQIKMLEIQKQKIIDDLKNATFIISGPSVQVLIGDFKRNDTPKNWPINLKSLDRMINYSYAGKYVANSADVKTEYLIVEDARKNGTIAGEIIYKIVHDDLLDSYDVFISRIRIYDTATDKTLVNEDVMQKAGRLDVGAAKKGTSETRPAVKVEKKPEPIPEPVPEPKPEPVAKPSSSDSGSYWDSNKETPSEKESYWDSKKEPPKEIVEVKTVIEKEVKPRPEKKPEPAKAKPSATVEYATPFENASHFSPNKDKTGYININAVNVKFEGKQYRGIKISGNTGKYKDYAWFEAVAWGVPEIYNFVRKGETIKFKVLGDGNTHSIRFNTRKEASFEFKFRTKKGVVTEVEVPYKKMQWVEWSKKGKLVTNEIVDVYFAALTENMNQNKDFDYTIFDVRVY